MSIPEPSHGSAWLAQDLSAYPADAPTWDVVIVGSGYGGAVAADTFSEKMNPEGQAVRVLVLERGREYVPGAFPSTLDELPSHVRIARAGHALIGQRNALFDLRAGDGVHALVGNGLGGGSLINGAVMVKPDFAQLPPHWPAQLVQDLTAEGGHLDRARQLLGAADAQGLGNTIDRHTYAHAFLPLPKAQALQNVGGEALPCRPVPLTIAMSATHAAGAPLQPCSLCGDCLTGCNVGARASLDVQLLARAARQGAQLFCNATVLRLERDNALWCLDVEHSDPKLQRRRAGPLTVRAHKVVLAAGSFGSTEILLRSAARDRRASDKVLKFSGLLGHRFSANGDNLMAIGLPGLDTRLVGDEQIPLTNPQGLSPRRVGPQITHELLFPADAIGPGFRVQEFAVPAALKPLWEEAFTTRRMLEHMTRYEGDHHSALDPTQADPLAVDPAVMRQTLLVGLIGHDSATGVLRLPRDAKQEGQLRLEWPQAAEDPTMRRAYDRLHRHVTQAKGTVIPNPMWQMLPDELRFIAGSGTGSVTTVHPLGGCSLGEAPHSGVVSPEGAVFDLGSGDPDGREGWFGSLLVLDGAIVPGSLGANPALTIAALTLRAAEHWCREWGWTGQPQGANPHPLPLRPQLRPPGHCTPTAAPSPTRFQIVERLVSHPVPGHTSWIWRQGDRTIPVVAEVSFGFAPTDLHSLTTLAQKQLPTDDTLTASMPGVNLLRLYDAKEWETRSLNLAEEHERQRYAKVAVRIGGAMHMLEREAGSPNGHRLRYLCALASNRLGRDAWRRFKEARADAQPLWQQLRRELWPIVRQIWRLSRSASEVRRLDYCTEVRELLQVAPGWEGALQVGDAVTGHKRLAYQARTNPWNQLLYLWMPPPGRLQLTSDGGNAHALKLDARFLAARGLPLVRITEQASQVRGLLDSARWGLYLLRLMLKIHALHLRRPDPPPAGNPQRLPGAIEGLPHPEIVELDVESTAGRSPQDAARVRLTRYRGTSQEHAPLVLIHGYSASGTSFAHPALQPGMARHFWGLGRDVWLLDLRTSSGMPSCRRAWTFEEVGATDIPWAIDHIVRQVARERNACEANIQVDVFAHCIGAVMISMALLGNFSAAGPLNRAQQALKGRIRRLALSQKGFVVEYRDANVLRAYLLNHIKGQLSASYVFRPPLFPSLIDRLYDAVLSTLPYPPDEWRKEHPLFAATPWAASRRRMDALYERTFTIHNLSDAVLHRIDDFFGPLNLETVSQTIHFARLGVITDRSGRNVFTSPTRLAQRWPTSGTLLISSTENGMVDPHSSITMEHQLGNAGVPNVRRVPIAGGHQDALIGLATAQKPLLDKLDVFFQ